MRYLVVVTLALGLCSEACSGGPFIAAPHTPLPLIAGHDEKVIAHPQLVTITFPGYAYTQKVQAFGDFIGGSKWLRTVGT